MSAYKNKNIIQKYLPDIKMWTDNGNVFLKDVSEDEVRERLKPYECTVDDLPEFDELSAYKKREWRKKNITFYELEDRYFILKVGTKACYLFEK